MTLHILGHIINKESGVMNASANWRGSQSSVWGRR